MEEAAPIYILEEGSKFISYESLSESIQQWERKNLVQLHKRRSRTVKSAARRATKKKYNEVWYLLKLTTPAYMEADI